MMSDIFRNASYVYVWLGRSNEITEAVMRTLKTEFRHYHDRRSTEQERKKGSNQRRRTNPDTAQSNNRDYQAECQDDSSSLTITELNDFFGNSYWTRLWIVQEIMLARYIRIICGETLLSWDELRRFVLSGARTLSAEAQSILPPQVTWLAEHALLAKTYSFASLLETFCTSECYDLRDKVFGLQGLVNEADRIPIDYSMSVRAVFRETAYAIFSREDEFSSTPYAKSIEDLDFEQPVEKVFLDAAKIISKEAECRFKLKICEILMNLYDSMEASPLPDSQRWRLSLEIDALWSEAALLYSRASHHGGTVGDKPLIGTIAPIVGRLVASYNELEEEFIELFTHAGLYSLVSNPSCSRNCI